MNISNNAAPSYPTRFETKKITSVIENSDYENDVYIILFRKLDGTLTQRVASRLSFTKYEENVRFYSSMEGTEGGYRMARTNRIFSLTKVSKNQIEKLAFADRL